MLGSVQEARHREGGRGVAFGTRCPSLPPPASVHLRLEHRQHLLEILVVARTLLVVAGPPPRRLLLLPLPAATWLLLLPLLLCRRCRRGSAGCLPAAASLCLAAM